MFDIFLVDDIKAECKAPALNRLANLVVNVDANNSVEWNTLRFCVLSRVRITSSGVVRNPAVAPEMKPLTTNVSKL